MESLDLPARPIPGDDSAASLQLGHLEIHPGEYQVLVAGTRLNLTVREFELFWALAQRPDHVVRRAELYERVWGEPMARRDRSVDVFVRKLRRKLVAASPDWSYIHTHFGIGYRFAPEPAGAPPPPAVQR